MDLETLIFERLNEDTELIYELARHNKEPAIFYVDVPADTDEGWEGKTQYPRLGYFYRLQSNPERQTSGELTIEYFIKLRPGEMLPERLEKKIIQAMSGVFLTPDEDIPYSFAWSNTEQFDMPNKDGDIVIGASVSFDMFAFPSFITTTPDPVAAIGNFTKALLPQARVIGIDPIEETTMPTPEEPIVYWSVTDIKQSRSMFAYIWYEAGLRGHVFTGNDHQNLILAKSITEALASTEMFKMADDSPFNIDSLILSTGSDVLREGQIAINGEYGVERTFEKSELLLHPYTKEAQ